MLLAIRERIMGVFGWVLLGLLAIAFSFFGLNSYLTGDSSSYAASVDGVDITQRQYQRAYQNIKDQMETMLGANYNPALIDEEHLRRTALESLIVNQLLMAESSNQKYAIRDQLIAKTLNDEDAFKEDGLFSREKYERTLKLQGATPQNYEGQLGREDQINQFRMGIVNTSTSSMDALDRMIRLTAQLRNFDYVVIPASKYASEITVSQDEIEEYYKANEPQFLAGEQVSLRYVELVSSDILSATQLSDDELLALYAEKIELYTVPEERKARHILIELSSDATDAEAAAAKAKAESLQLQLTEGASFEALAREHSDDTGSSGNGGDLGYFGRGMMVPAFEDAAFQLEKGEISKTVKSAFGYHIIRVDDIKGGEVTPFSEVKEELMASVISEEHDDLFYEQSDELANLAYENIDSLEPAADALGLEIKHTGWIKKSGSEGIGQYQQVVEAAFSPDLLQDGNNSDTIEIEDGHVIVIRVNEYQAAAMQPLEDVEDQIEAIVRKQTLTNMAVANGQAMLQELKSGADFRKLAEKSGIPVKNSGLVGRGDQSVPRELLREAFQLAYPAKDHPVPTALPLANGDYLVMLLLEVKQGNPEELADEVRKKLLADMGRSQGLTEMAAVIDYLKSSAVIDIPSR